MNWCVYMVRCADNTLYTGVTNALEKRLAAHNSGKGAKYTKTRRPVQLVYQEVSSDRSTALQREYALKQLSRHEKLKLMAAAESARADRSR